MGFRVKEGGSSGGTPPPTGSPNFYKEIGAGLGIISVVKATQEQGVGFGIEQAPATLLTEQTVGLGVNTFASGLIVPNTATGMRMGSVLNMVIPPQDEAGFDIVTRVYSYVGTKPIETATNIGADNFTNVTNAQGNPDGSSATRTGQALSTTNAQIRGQHIAVPQNDDVDISLVELRFYASQAGTALNNGGLELAYRANSAASWITLVTYAGNVNFLSSPDVYVISGLTTWADVNSIETRVSAVLPTLSATVTVNCDSVVKYAEGVEP
jgi:hypothetical protein